MHAFAFISCVLVLTPPPTTPKHLTVPTRAELDAITERGRQLSAYDVAAWHATDAMIAQKPDASSVVRYIAHKTPNGWVVEFGKFTPTKDKFLVAFEAVQGETPETFTAQKFDPPKPMGGFTFFAARAVETALADFRTHTRIHNVAVLPAPFGKLWVYVYPAQTSVDFWPAGGDVRYHLSGDGAKILEKRRLHVSIIDLPMPKKGEKFSSSIQSAILDNIPEDTDVFSVLSRHTHIPEYIVTQKFVYRIETNGVIHYAGLTGKPTGKANQIR